MKTIDKLPTVFLDRDGVLTIENGYAISSLDEMKIFDYAADCIKSIKDMGYLAIVVTNQSAVAKGIFSIEELNAMNMKLMDDTGVDAIYYCPHHPHGKIPEYTKVCNCRKPEPGLIEQAQKDFNIDMSHSYMIGDRACDILLAENAGLKSVLVNSGYGKDGLEARCKPDYVLADLTEFVQLLKHL